MKRILFNETCYFGSGAIQAAGMEAGKRSWKKALLVTDATMAGLGAPALLARILDKAGVTHTLFSEVTENPGIAVVQRAVQVFTAAGADHIIALGGGSSLDTAKAVSVIAANPGHMDVRSLEGEVAVPHRGVPVIAISTTAGSGSEANMNFVITDEAAGRKIICTSPSAIPAIAVVDPDLMGSMPSALTASTGMDALTHAIEGFLTRGAWELTDTLNLKAMELIARSLRGAVRGDPKAREEVALGQYITGLTFANIGLGLAHGMAHPLSAVYGTAHGLANAVLLPYVLEYNAIPGRTGEKYRPMARALGVRGTDDLSLPEAVRLAVAAVRLLARDVGIPPTLERIGVQEEDLPRLADMAMADACTAGNPRNCSRELVEAVFRKAFRGK